MKTAVCFVLLVTCSRSHAAPRHRSTRFMTTSSSRPPENDSRAAAGLLSLPVSPPMVLALCTLMPAWIDVPTPVMAASEK